jgi:NitT/TauT family transport system ATP-binding protein
LVLIAKDEYFWLVTERADWEGARRVGVRGGARARRARDVGATFGATNEMSAEDKNLKMEERAGGEGGRGDASSKLITFEGVSKSFATSKGPLQAVRDLNITIRAGECVTLVGPSGCGKSTLLNMIAGLMKPTAGVVRYRDVEVKDINRRVGYMTQNDHLLPWRTIARNIAVPLEIKGVGRAQRTERVRELMSLVGLSGFEASYPAQVSGGMRKRAALARLLAGDPETLLMDEPFAALDAQLRLTMQIELLKIQARFGKTIVFVTHDLDEAISLADRCFVFCARPGTVTRTIETGLPAARDLAQLRFDPRFLELARGLWKTLTPDLSH